jgi:hypothetical protein
LVGSQSANPLGPAHTLARASVDVAPIKATLFFTNNNIVDASSLHFIAEDIRKAKDLTLLAAAAKLDS